MSLNIGGMRVALDGALEGVFADMRREFSAFFDSLVQGDILRLDGSNAVAELHELTNRESLDVVPNTPAFYVIFSDFKVDGSPSRLMLSDGRRAIYRGEGATARYRLESHLFNTAYEAGFDGRRASKDKFSENYYGACLKIKEDESGIDIDDEPYSRARWAVLVVRLPRSTSVIRKQAELAFDNRFRRPAASREI
ncbi:hypothetical protein [Variovorax boronicumulans]|uniref:hypothetical protein n=1 Tax=Variovorax boronicumulans TaxID=436515 RepID=UPI0012E46CB4|nr:hypothetical protein [Variovorax boronicumulans]GER16373.1 hypothetical protein VCH24_13740 [Variovorax boronicumulans]